MVSAPPAAGEAARSRRAPGNRDSAGLGVAPAIGFLAPGLLLIGLFLIFPALWTIYIGLTNYTLTGATSVAPAFVGLGNFAEALNDALFGNALWLTLVYTIGSAVLGQNIVGFALAWVLRGARPALRRTIETFVLLSWILPTVVIAYLWIAVLDRDGGTLDLLLGSPGTAWLIEYPMASLIVFNTWHGTAFSMMLYSSALAAVPPSQLETARSVGASGWQTVRDVVFPHIRGHVLTNTLLISLWTANDFTPFLLTAGGPNHESELVPVFIYRQAISSGRLGYAAAISFLLLLVNLVVALVYLLLLRKRA
ncbi:MAG TPA: sugar ABC transporter permease [Actinophytocola sp.]|uniref:carbohydrate ABC transporter permease n=1 Tax=Actinophytocola sp. TaxID=1872138 RepID=UPI002F9284E8